MLPHEMSKIITEFCEKHYPKGSENRGVAMVVLTLFLIWQNEKKELPKK